MGASRKHKSKKIAKKAQKIKSENIRIHGHFLRFLVNEANDNQLMDMLFEIDNKQLRALREVVRNSVKKDKEFAEKFRKSQPRKTALKRIENFVKKLLTRQAGRAMVRNNRFLVKYLLKKGLKLFDKNPSKWKIEPEEKKSIVQSKKKKAAHKKKVKTDDQRESESDNEDENSSPEESAEEEESDTEQNDSDNDSGDEEEEEEEEENQSENEENGEYYMEGESEEEEESDMEQSESGENESESEEEED